MQSMGEGHNTRMHEHIHALIFTPAETFPLQGGDTTEEKTPLSFNRVYFWQSYWAERI